MDSGSQSRGIVVLVEDDALVLRALARVVSRDADVVTASDTSGARCAFREVPRRDLVAAIVDVHLPGGDGLALVRELREASPQLPILVMTGDERRTLPNEAAALDARFALKPVGGAEVAAFVRWALAAQPSRRLEAALVELEAQHALTTRERVILRTATSGVARPDLAQACGVAENTVKAQVRSLLRKCQASSLESLTRRIYVRALAR